MTRDGIKKCIKAIQLSYQNAYKSFTGDDLKMLIEVWGLQFRNADDVAVFRAVNQAISTNDYPPSIAEIKRNLMGMDEINEEEMWSLLLIAGSNGIYGSEEEWEKLPEDLKAVTTPWTIREIALADNDSLHYIKKDILASLRYHKKKKTEALLSTSYTDQKLIGYDDDEDDDDGETF